MCIEYVFNRSWYNLFYCCYSSFTIFTTQTVLYGWDIIQVKFCGVVFKHSFHKCFCNAWWWLFVKAETCCSISVCTALQNVVVIDCPYSTVFYLYITRRCHMWRCVRFIVMQLVTGFCGRCSHILHITCNFYWFLKFFFCDYCSESFASLQEDENERLIWKNTWEFQNLRFMCVCMYVFNIWIIALNAELHLYSHINYRAQWSSLSSVWGLPCQTCSYGPWTDVGAFHFIRIYLKMNTRTILLCWKSWVNQHCQGFELKCSGD